MDVVLFREAAPHGVDQAGRESRNQLLRFIKSGFLKTPREFLMSDLVRGIGLGVILGEIPREELDSPGEAFEVADGFLIQVSEAGIKWLDVPAPQAAPCLPRIFRQELKGWPGNGVRGIFDPRPQGAGRFLVPQFVIEESGVKGGKGEKGKGLTPACGFLMTLGAGYFKGLHGHVFPRRVRGMAGIA